MNEEWISARDALKLLRPECNSFSPSTAEAICRYAAVGKVRAKAASFTVKGRGKAEQSEDCLIPPRFWQVTLEKQDWHHGIFVSVERGTDLLIGGVDWEIRCEAFDVWLDRKGIEALEGDKAIPPNDIAPTAKRGRPKGSGSFVSSDAILVEIMHEYITDRPGTSANFAAGQVVDRAAGGGTEDTKRRRLARRYKKANPN